MSETKTRRELLPEQAAAAHELDKHISVTAGPGSGKTTVLVERYLEILRRNPSLNIDQVVAITFTNRAANEMRERLRSELNFILQTAPAKTRKTWLSYKRTLDGAVITTIHGFCARLLREFPVEARIDPQFVLLDEHRAAMLLESAVEDTLSEFIVAGHVEISRLTLGVGRGRLAEALAHLYREVRGQGLGFEDLARLTAESHATEIQHGHALRELSGAMSDFFAVRRTTANARGKHAEGLARWTSVHEQIGTIPNVEGLADYCRLIEYFREVRPQARDALKEHVEAIDELVWAKDLAGRVPQIALDLFAKQYALELALLLREIDDRLTAKKQQLSALDFDDLELRTLDLLQRQEVITRAAERYKFFLVDEFQDTNGLQRKLLEKLALRKDDSANLFIVGDSKQSIYGFRGADVTVFSEMTQTLLTAGGEAKPLLLNFRSQPPLINFFNHLFARLFQPDEEVPTRERAELGYVAHEHSDAKRELRDSGPLIELLITTEASRYEDDPKADQNSRELDAEQLALRIASLVDAASTDSERGPVKYSDIALLFRAMTHVDKYESAFRRASIPYQTVLGRGFYEREEITDLMKLLRFLDNKTDELALAAVLRSPLGGISDNALLALRCAPWSDELDAGGDALKNFSQTRNLYRALRSHQKIAFISDEEHGLLARAAQLTQGLIARQHQYSLSSLLRFAVEESEFKTVIAATFDGAQRLANVQRLFTLAERFERSGAHLIRDFVRYVEEFEAIGSRESEGQIDEAANAVRLMTVHQAKGLEFPIVVIPDLQRLSKPMDSWVLLDRKRGLTLKVPDGRGNQVAGLTFNQFQKRHEWRETFESMRLLYVAATRAEDRLILSGTTKDLDRLGQKKDTWLGWIWQSLGVPFPPKTGLLDLADNVQLQVTLNLAAEQNAEPAKPAAELPLQHAAATAESIAEAFPLLREVTATGGHAVYRFSVTQLINYQRCPRQYYFDRVLHAPAPDALAVWNDAEAPEPPANLTATLKGAVIHRFCETYNVGEGAEEVLRRSFVEVVRNRQAQLADRLVEINETEALAELLPLAENYLNSAVFERVERARASSSSVSSRNPRGEAGLWSELSFRLRRPLGILSGAIDKLLITPAANGKDLIIEVIDFKTNRLRATSLSSVVVSETPLAGEANGEAKAPAEQTIRSRSRPSTDQFAFDFNAQPKVTPPAARVESALADQVRHAATDYQLQMQAYVLAVRELLPGLTPNSEITSTLHFLEPNEEFHLPDDLLVAATCADAIDEAMVKIVSSAEPVEFPVCPAAHCRRCNFVSICPPGRAWLKSRRQSGDTSVNLAAVQTTR